MSTIQIPKKIYNDHMGRDLPAPKIDKTDNAPLAELLDDAIHYSNCREWWDSESRLGMQSSARATVAAIRKALPNLKPEAM